MLSYGVLLFLSLHLFRFFVLVLHLEQKHEEGQRLLHNLQQTYTALATGIFLCMCNNPHTEKIVGKILRRRIEKKI